MSNDGHVESAPREELDGKKFMVGPSTAPYWKFWLSNLTLHIGTLPGVKRIPGWRRLMMWSLKIQLGTRDMWEVDD